MPTVGIIGAGVMGAGIAQVAAQHGSKVILADISQAIAQQAVNKIAKSLQRLREKGKLSAGEVSVILEKITPCAGPEAFARCDVVIEAVAERLDVKTSVLRRALPCLRSDAILASNTSSLSISALGQALDAGKRIAGMHFFNPVPLMPLVEVIRGQETTPETVEQVAALAAAWGKTIVIARDTPGFIVNRIARGYYLEALRLFGEGIAAIPEIDRTMKELGGFRMGPFELMDLVGIDVNYSVSVSVWEQLGKPARLAPHPIQARLFEQGEWGRKSGRGFYDYATTPPTPRVSIPHQSPPQSEALTKSMSAVVERGALRPGSPVENFVFARILVGILNEAALAFDDKVASREDIDTAMRLGTNYPQGPLHWADTIGIAACRELLLALNELAGDNRYQPAGRFMAATPA